jgi:hypothetical protein
MYAFSPSSTAFLHGMPRIRPKTLICEDRRLQKKRGLKIDFWVDFLGLRDPSIEKVENGVDFGAPDIQNKLSDFS